MSAVEDLRNRARYEQFKEDWTEFHGKYPEIYQIFSEAVHRDIRYLEERGLLFIKKISLRRIFKNIKWKGVDTDRKDGYTINNDFYKIYAFQWEANYPQFAGIFEHRGYIPTSIAKIIQSNQGRILIAKKRYQRNKKKATA